jgi:Zn-dependent membrane protease YugP
MPKKRVALAIAASLAFVVVMLGILTDEFFVMWLGWALMFAGLEAITVVHEEKDDTLSEQIQFGTLSKNKVWNVIWKSVTGAVLIWLLFHLPFGL